MAIESVTVIAGDKTLIVKPGRVAEPPGVDTLTSPVAPVPITAFMVVAFETMNEAAAAFPKLTPVAPEKLDPVMVTVSPEEAEVGAKEEIVGVKLGVSFFPQETNPIVSATHARIPVSVFIFIRVYFSSLKLRFIK